MTPRPKPVILKQASRQSQCVIVQCLVHNNSRFWVTDLTTTESIVLLNQFWPCKVWKLTEWPQSSRPFPRHSENFQVPFTDSFPWYFTMSCSMFWASNDTNFHITVTMMKFKDFQEPRTSNFKTVKIQFCFQSQEKGKKRKFLSRTCGHPELIFSILQKHLPLIPVTINLMPYRTTNFTK